MAASDPPSARKKAPFFVYLALSAAWMFGGCGAMSGWDTIQGDPFAQPSQYHGIENDAERAVIMEENEKLGLAHVAAHQRLVALGAAEMVLGAAMFFLTWMTLARREGSRSLLVQVVGAYGALAAIEYALLPDVRAARVRAMAALLELTTRNQPPELRAHLMGEKIASSIPSMDLAIRLLIMASIIFALTRPRARAVLDVPRDVGLQG